MQILPVDLTEIVAVIMGVSIVLVPVMGLTARFALSPLVESLGRVMEGRGAEENARILERRIQLLEQQVESMEGSLRRVAEVTEFHSDLRAGGGPATLPRTGAPPAGEAS